MHQNSVKGLGLNVVASNFSSRFHGRVQDADPLNKLFEFVF